MDKREDKVVQEAMRQVQTHRRRRLEKTLLRLVVAGWALALAAFFLAPLPLPDKVWAALHGLCSQQLFPQVHMLSFAGEMAAACVQDGAFASANLESCRFLPLCARDSGIYVGILLGVAYLLARGRWRAAGRPTRWFWLFLIAVLSFLGVDVLNSIANDWFGRPIYPPHNGLRLATGLLTGLALAVLLLWVINTALAGRRRERSILPHGGDLGGLFLIGAAAGAALWSAWPPLYIPLTVLSVAGIVLTLLAANTLAILTITRGRETLESIWEAAIPLAGGSIATVVEMAALSWLRYRTGL